MAGAHQQSSGGGGSQPSMGNNDGSLDFMWLLVAILVTLSLSWYFGKAYISAFVLKVRLYEIDIIQYVIYGWSQVADIFHLPMPDTSVLLKWKSYIQNNPGTAPVKTLVDVSGVVGNYIRYFSAGLLTIIGSFLYFSHTGFQFNHKFSMKKLRDVMQLDWPQIAPVMKLDLLKEDIEKGPWAMAATPLPFAKKYKLVKEEEKDNQVKLKVIKGAAYRIFTLQLGSQWEGVDKLPIHTKALLAIFAARANYDSDAAEKLLRQISASSKNSHLNFAGIDGVLSKYYSSKPVKKAIKQHAYVLSVMATMLEFARIDGVFATADFLWLKPVDRKLWYMLNSVGRQTAVIEVAGPFAHWLAERAIGRPLFMPTVDEAVTGLEVAINEIRYIPESAES